MQTVIDHGGFIEVIAGHKRVASVLLDPTDYYRLRELGTKTLCLKWRRRYPKCVTFSLDGIVYRVSRFITTCPNHLHVDHINRNPFDNRQSNLRCITHRQNQHNRGNNTKYPGTHFNKQTQSWHAVITIKRKRIYLGHYSTQELAKNAYDNFVRLHNII